MPIAEVWKGFEIRLENQRKDIELLHRQVQSFITNSIHALENLGTSNEGVFEWKPGHFTSVREAKSALCRLTEVVIELEDCKTKLQVERDATRRQAQQILSLMRDSETLKKGHSD